MSQQSIINAAPLTILLGTQDASTRQVAREREAIPTHCPLSFFFAKKGPTTRQLVVGGSRVAMYGAESFDIRSKYANHATVFSNAFNKAGNAQMAQRVVPTDANGAANLTLWLEVVPAELTDYVRNTDGSIAKDSNGNPIVRTDGTDPILLNGHKVRWSVTSEAEYPENSTFGQKTIVAGTLVENTVTAQKYPIMELKMSYQGEDGNNTGLRIWAPTLGTGGQYDKRILTRNKVLPVRMQVIRRNTQTQTSKPVETIFGEPSVLVTLKPGVVNSVDDSEFSITDKFLNSYQNLTDPGLPALFGEFGELHVYDDNIKDLTEMFYTAEKSFLDVHNGDLITPVKTDFSEVPGNVAGDEWLFNLFSGKSTDGWQYHTYDIVGGGNSVRLGEFTNLFAGGGSDGTMNDATFAGLVEQQMEEYANENSDVHNTAVNVTSVIYDSGFPLQTKKSLLNLLAHRKDTFVHLGTHEVGGMRLTASQDYSLAVSLRAAAQLFPESEYFGTSVARALIMGRSGKIRAHQFKKDISPLYEVAVKSSDYMGAGDGKWKAGKNFDGGPNHVLKEMYDISVPYTSASGRIRDWDAGLNWVESFDRSSNCFPALKTVYTDDTSVLNSYFTAMAIVEINKVCERARRYYSGVSNLTDEQLAERIDRFIVENTTGRFDGRFIIEPNTYYTDGDKARGYSWTTQVTIYAPSMKTVMTAYVTARRMSDYTAAA